jgi:hypothetical protein
MRLSPDRPSHPDCQRGAASLEFALLLPFVALTFSLLIGLGYTLSSKQHAQMAARFGAYSYAERNVEPTPDQVNQAAYQGIETWTTVRTENSVPFSADAFIDGATENIPVAGGILGEFMSGIAGVFVSLVNELTGGTPSVEYAASTPVDRGMVAYIAGGSLTASSRHYLPKGTWTCAQLGNDTGGYLGFIFENDNEVVRVVLEVVSAGGYDPDASCCNNYGGS